MIQLLDHTTPDLIAFRATGKLQTSDYQVLRPLFEERIQRFGTIRVYAEMLDLESISPKAIWEELKIDLKYANKVSQAAMVGDTQWEEWLVKASKPFISGEMRYFDFHERDTAWAWITGGTT